MVYWKPSTSSTQHGSPFAPISAASTRRQEQAEEEDVMYKMTALEITVLIITFLAFIGQFVNLYFAIVDHMKIQQLVKGKSA
jgi:hypothetical protein